VVNFSSGPNPYYDYDRCCVIRVESHYDWVPLQIRLQRWHTNSAGNPIGRTFMKVPDDEWCMSVYRNWAAGLCVCCGAHLDWYAESAAIGEGVMICGLCLDRGHDQDDLAPFLLAGVLQGRKLHSERPALSPTGN